MFSTPLFSGDFVVMGYEESLCQRARKTLRNHLIQHSYFINDKAILTKSHTKVLQAS